MPLLTLSCCLAGRDFDALKKHVEEELEVKCSVEDQAGCTDKEKGFIKKMQDGGAEKVQGGRRARLPRTADDAPHLWCAAGGRRGHGTLASRQTFFWMSSMLKSRMPLALLSPR